jgi:hypothetical protein
MRRGGMKKMVKFLVLFGILSVFFSCRNEEDNRPRIEKIEFETEKKSSIEGDTVKITVIAEPIEAKKHDTIKYWTSDNSIIEIMTESNNDYVVFKGLKQGQAIIKASVNGMDIFCDVIVISSNGTLIPYIVVSDYVIESETGQKHQIIASLIGGLPSDNNDFEWNYTGQNKNVINMVATNNVAVIDTLNVGDSVVTVSHKKALFSVDTLVFVREKGEIPVYITTSTNVISMRLNEEMKEYSVNLFGKNIGGSDNTNYHLFRHDIVDAGDEIVKESSVIGLQYRNNIGTIKPKAAGIAKIRVSHQDADYPIDIVVIVNEVVEFRYIDTEDTVIIMDEGAFRMVRTGVVGNVPDDYVEKFDYVNEDNSVIEVSRSQNIISIKALKNGKSVIKIKNEYVDYDKEILIIVNGIETLIDQERYITTNQNVITTEVNGEATLKMTLVGGNSADANSFVWAVDDGSIIEMENQHGSVRYKNLRSMADSTEERFEATALIKAKKIGTTTITLENPKAKNSFQVIVKVYKQNVLGVVPIVLSGSSLYKIEQGKILNVYLSVAAGLERNFTSAQWESSDKSVFTVENNTALTGVLRGIGYGVATLTVKGDNLKNEEFSAVVIVGDNDYFNEKPYIYVSNPYMTLIKDRTVSFKVNCVNVLEEDIKNLSVVNHSGGKLEVFSYRNNVTVRGLSFGEGEIIISGEGLNTLKVTVMVEDYALTPDMPYYLRTEKYIYGMVKRNSIEIQVDLVGGIAVNEKNIGWKISDANIASIKGNGKKCIITGINEGQTVLKASHYQAQNKEVEIVIYVVLSDAELKSKVVTHVPEQNILLRQGETRFISVVTNAVEGQDDFRWGNGNANVIGLRVNGDKKSAFIDGVALGNATITVGYGNQVPYVIYVSVIGESFNSAYINVPSIVETVAGQTITVNAATSSVPNIYEMTWVSQDDSIAKAYGNGDKCTVTAFKGGKTVIEVRYPSFAKDIVLRVYDNADEMASAYIFSGEQTRYVINKGDIVNIGLVFGMKGYPEHDLPNIRWTTSDSSKIDLKGNGKTASVQGIVAGFWKIKAADNYDNNVEIEIAVQEAGKAGKYSFSIDSGDRIKGMLASTDVVIPVKVINSEGNEVYNVSGIRYAAENGDIISVEAKEGGVKVYAKPEKEGQSYITITHDLAEDGKILIYTSLTEGGLANAFPIMVEKSNYMVEKGNAFSIRVQTINDNSSKLADINYRLEKENGVLSIQERNKKEIAVSAEKEGSEVILIYYNTSVVQRVYVSVMEKGYGQNEGYIITEGIIGLVMGQVYETRVDSNISNEIEWISDNELVCSISSKIYFMESSGYNEDGIEYFVIDKRKAGLIGVNKGKTIVKVKNGNIERHILVFVVETQEELKSYNTINIEQRNYKINKGADITINVKSYQGKVEGDTKIEDYYRYSVPYGNVLTVNKKENGKISVRGINEGIAAIRITNSYYNFETVVYVEVYPANEGAIDINKRDHYITAEKTLYILSKDVDQTYIQLSVVPQENFYGDSFWEWYGYDNSIISVNALGRSAVVRGIKDGETKIKIQNQMCENTFEITVIVGERFIFDSGKVPYIYVEKDVFEMTNRSNDLLIPYNIVNVNNFDINKIDFNYSSGITVTHDEENSVFKVKALNTGIARLMISYEDLRKEIFVLVKENLNVGNIYFTTSENYVIAGIGELRNINVNLIGYDEIDNSRIKWSLSKDSPQNVVQLVGNGLIGQIYGVAEGSAVINISHDRNDEYRAVYSLSINVKVVKDRSKENVVYLTTQRNVIETVENSMEEMIYIQKVGGDPVKNQIEWIVDNSNIVSLEHTGGYSARLRVFKEGTVKITVRNKEAVYDLNIIVVVRKSTGSDVYITTENNLLWLSPGDQNYKISVNLVNGEEKNFKLINWFVEMQIPSDINVPAGSKVINIMSSNEQCYIDAVNEGTARIRVECSGVDLPLFITVYVSQFKEVRFGVTHKDVILGELEIVSLELPTYERLKDKAFVSALEINSESPSSLINVYYTNSIVLIQANPNKTGSARVRAEVAGKEGYAELTVSVVEGTNANRIIISRNVFVVGKDSGQFIINAGISGPDIYDYDLDEIEWEIITNYKETDTKKENPYINMYPQNISVTKSKGRMVQITPKNMGNAVIRVSHKKVVNKYWKEIYIVVEKYDNNFMIIPEGPIDVNTSLSAPTIEVSIIGGTNRDYEQVRWVAEMQPKWDGTSVEVVRIMGSGRQIMLYPVNNGITYVHAFYNGEMRSIEVKCVSDYYFNIANRNELMYPTQERDLEYEISPATNWVDWMYTPDSSGAVIVLNEIMGSSPGGVGNIRRKIKITALKEGVASIIGIPVQGRPVMVNITVKYDFAFVINGDANSTVVTATDKKNPKNNPKYEYWVNNSPIICDGVLNVPYTVYPGDVYLKTIGAIPSGLLVDIAAPVDKGNFDNRNRAKFEGVIKFTGLIEMKAYVKFGLYRINKNTLQEEQVVVDGNPIERSIEVIYLFDDDVGVEPIFIRGDGLNSHRNYINYTINTFSEDQLNALSVSQKAKWKKNGKDIDKGEKLLERDFSGAKYPYITLADGEEHHVILDKKYESADINITSVDVYLESGSLISSATENADGKLYDYKVKYGEGNNKEHTFTTFTVGIGDVGINGENYKAVRLSGGKDYINYNRLKSNRELVISTKSHQNFLNYSFNNNTYNSDYILSNVYDEVIPCSCLYMEGSVYPWRLYKYKKAVWEDLRDNKKIVVDGRYAEGDNFNGYCVHDNTNHEIYRGSNGDEGDMLELDNDSNYVYSYVGIQLESNKYNSNSGNYTYSHYFPMRDSSDNLGYNTDDRISSSKMSYYDNVIYREHRFPSINISSTVSKDYPAGLAVNVSANLAQNRNPSNAYAINYYLKDIITGNPLKIWAYAKSWTSTSARNVEFPKNFDASKVFFDAYDNIPFLKGTRYNTRKTIYGYMDVIEGYYFDISENVGSGYRDRKYRRNIDGYSYTTTLNVDDIQGTGHDRGINIFDNENNITKYGSYGRKLYTSSHDSVGNNLTRSDTGIIFSPVWVQHRASWINVSTGSSTIYWRIYPAHVLNRFPFRYENYDFRNNENQEKIKKQLIYLDDTGNSSNNTMIPMPSIDRGVQNENGEGYWVTLKINYTKRNALNGNLETKSVGIKIRCEVRESSFVYYGVNTNSNFDESYAQYSQTAVIPEKEGPINTFELLYKSLGITEEDKKEKILYLAPVLKYTKAYGAN